MPNNKTGQSVACCVCGTEVYKQAAYLARGYKRITCGNPDCKKQKFMGEGNPFWGKTHDEASRIRIRKGRAANPPKKTGPPKGFKHTPEARAKIQAASKKMWAENRDKMLASHAHLKTEFARETARYRKNFSPAQRRDWKDAKCKWCDSAADLVLDHIIAVSCGGGNWRENCQTLCRSCNLWKMSHIDLAQFRAGLGKRQDLMLSIKDAG